MKKQGKAVKNDTSLKQVKVLVYGAKTSVILLQLHHGKYFQERVGTLLVLPVRVFSFVSLQNVVRMSGKDLPSPAVTGCQDAPCLLESAVTCEDQDQDSSGTLFNKVKYAEKT